MRTPRSILISALAALLMGSAAQTAAQDYVGPLVDRNVGDTGPNAASQRYMQPGLGQFGVGSLLRDRFSNEDPYQSTRFDPFNNDPRVSQRYLMQSPGVSALIERPDYIGPSPHGGWVMNAQTYDGAEILTLTPANTVFILSPELLQPTRSIDADLTDHPNRVQPQSVGNPYSLMLNAQVDGRAYTRPDPALIDRAETYVHPEILERRRLLRAEREAEEAARQAAELEAAESEGLESEADATQEESSESAE